MEAHRGFTESLPVELVEEWERLCIAWDTDSFPRTAENPYQTAGAGVTEDEARQELDREEEASRIQRGVPALHSTSAPAFLGIGLELEDDQRQLKVFASEQANIPRNLQDTSLKDRREVLQSKIQGWEQIRNIYMPGLLQFLTELGANPLLSWDASPNPEDVDLWLPSSIPQDRRRAVCIEGLPDMELKLRTAQCSGSLDGLRQVLRLKTRMVYYKNKNIRGQRQGTRSRAMIDRVHVRAIRLVRKYRDARKAKLALEGPGGWETVFRELKNEDVRSYAARKKKQGPSRRGIWEDGHEPPPIAEAGVLSSESESEIEIEEGVRLTEQQMWRSRKKGTGETRKQISWIWLTTPMNVEDEEDANEILRLEWARSRARCQQAVEETRLLVEEMRRVLQYLEWRTRWWESRKARRTDVNIYLQEGIASYATGQAELQQALASSFRILWKTPLQDVETAVGTGTEELAGIEDGSIDVDGDDDEDEVSAGAGDLGGNEVDTDGSDDC